MLELSQARHMEKQLKLAAFIANLLDNQFEIFGRRFGLNGLVGIIPGLGDAIPMVLSFYLVWVALQLQLPPARIFQMIWNIIYNFLIGLIPVVGDYVDFFNHANLKNLKILQEFTKNPVIEGEIVDKKTSIII